MDGVGSPTSGPAGRLIGRDGDLALLRSFLREAVDHGGALLLAGEPGIGKSVVLDVAAAQASAAGTLVLRATGLEFLADLSFSTLKQLLLPLRGGFDDLDPVHRDALTLALGLGSQGTSDRLVVYNAVLALLRRAAAERPLLLVVDDLQWIDRATAALLGFVARRLTGSRAGLLAAVRPGVEGFFSRTGLVQHMLAPLDDADAAALVDTRFPMLDPRTRRRLLGEAQGNPLALLELPLTLSAAQRGAGHALPPVLPLSRRLRALFGARVEALPPPTRRLLLLAALEGGGDLAVVLRAAAGGAGLADLVPAERAHLVTVDPGGRQLTFRHPLVRSTVVEVCAVRVRLAAHGALARALAAEPERHLWHLAAATPDPDERVAGQLERMAHLARRRGDAVGAFTALLRSADLSTDRGQRSRRLAEAAYLGADVTGELRTTARLLVEARRADPAVRGSLKAAVAASHLLLNGAGDIDMAHRLLGAAIQNAAAWPDGDARALSEALHTLLDVCLYGARPELWPAFHDAMSRLPADPPAVLRLLVDVLAGFAHLTEADVTALEAAVESLGSETDPTRIERIATAALFLDRASGCREALWRIVDDGRTGGAVTSAINALMVLAMDDVMTGRWDEATRLAEEGIALCEGHGYRLLRWPFRLAQAVLAAARGDDATLRGLLREMDDWARPRQAGTVQQYARYAGALAALARGDAEQAFHDLATISPPGVLPFGVPIALWTGMDLVEAAVRSGRRAEAAAHVAALHRAGIAALSPHLALLVTASAALAAPDDRTGELFERALSIPGTDHWPFDLARVHLAYGGHLHRTRQTAAARPHLATALDTFHRLGAHPWATHAAAVLRAAGEHAPRDVTAPALTAQERQIALLAASGLTNKQIGRRLLLSHRTVGACLHRIFPKLGITSRTALRDALSALPTDDLAVNG